jgi:hypothetical protein
MRKYRKKTKKKVKFRRNKTRVKREKMRGGTISIHQLMSTIGANPNPYHVHKSKFNRTISPP